MNLPHEIYLHIFSLLDKRVLLNCIVVCKEWSVPAFQVYYKVVTINNRRTKILKALLDQEQCFKYCHWTKKVSIFQDGYVYRNREVTYKPESTFTKQEFLEFFKYLPNLRKIEILTQTREFEYIGYLLDIDTSEHLTKLENIFFMDITFHSRLSDLFCSVYYNFRGSLTHILIYHKCESLLTSQFGGIVNYLSPFKKLTQLTYHNYTEHHPTISEIQAACPSLTSIEMINTHHIPLFQADSNTHYHHSNLKTLSVSFPSLPTNYIEYITNYLPRSVENLDITITAIDLYDWIGQVGMNHVLKLAKGMSKLPRASLRCTPGRQYETQHENTDKSNITTFFKVLNAFKGDKKVTCTVSFWEDRPCDSMSFHAGKLHVEYGGRYTDLYDIHGEDRIIQLSVPDKTVSVLGAEVINYLNVFICTRADIELPFEILKHTFINCPHLRLVRFIMLKDPRYEFMLCSSIFPYDKGVESYDPSTASKVNLKTARIRNFIPSQEFLDLLCRYLPGIQGFTCRYEGYDVIDNTGEPRDYIVDLTRLKNLHLFYFDIQLVLTDSKLNSCFIKFEYTDGEENYYYFEDKKNAKFEPTSFETIQKDKQSRIIFRCEKIQKFALYCSNELNFFEILEGIPQKNRGFENEYDMKYMDIIY